MTVITLLTDFGVRDGYPGVMKGVIWKIAPDVQIADISHQIKPQDIFHGALTLSRTAWFFPAGTIHIAVVDPGVGTKRRPIGLKLGDYYFVGPDNGLFTLVLEHAEKVSSEIFVVHLDQSSYWLPEVSQVFHGRDLFAPVAAHLAIGIPITKLGTMITDPVRLSLPKPEKTDFGWVGQVIHIDHFGNLSTNLQSVHIAHKKEINIVIREMRISGLVSTFGEKPPGTLVALIDSNGFLAISIVNGNAEQSLHVDVGERVEVIL